MVKYLNYVFVSIISVILGTGCTQKIDFENDVPQRAKSISKQQADNVRSSMEVPELKKEYKNYVTQQRKAKSLADLEKEKREIEKKIAYVIQADSSKVCAVCRKRLKASSKKSLVMQKGKNAKNTKNAKNKKNKTSRNPSIVKTNVKTKAQSMNKRFTENPAFNSPADPNNKQGVPPVSGNPPQSFQQPPLLQPTPMLNGQPPLQPQPALNLPFPQPQPQPQPPFLPQQPLGFNPPMFPPVPGNQQPPQGYPVPQPQPQLQQPIPAY